MSDNSDKDFGQENIKKFESTIKLLEYEIEAINSHCTMAINQYCKLHAQFRIQQEELSESLMLNLKHEMEVSKLKADIEGIEESLAYENINNDSLSVTITKQADVIESLKKASLDNENFIDLQNLKIKRLQEQLCDQAPTDGSN
ncbi:MAG: hypothetical protein JKY80_01580 [Mariprofundaceae bacterium]|nr:hypothetical protein [Mariprofundaceae bacterium]